ncbi:MAG TPA: MotA/TolQ/ExbB proton channel family protein [Opitutaceae bacterium]|nr:MotA/TolQ/ExbB proton channel family protein [Opitutaceae bacterium]
MAALTVVIERLVFILSEKTHKQPKVIEKIFLLLETGEVDEAAETGAKSRDGLARVLAYGLQHREESLTNALMRAAGQELKRYNQGLQILDTIITLAPLLGLLGTVTGMIDTFGIIRSDGLGDPRLLAGGIREALIATECGLAAALPLLLLHQAISARLRRAELETELGGGPHA